MYLLIGIAVVIAILFLPKWKKARLTNYSALILTAVLGVGVYYKAPQGITRSIVLGLIVIFVLYHITMILRSKFS